MFGLFLNTPRIIPLCEWFSGWVIPSCLVWVWVIPQPRCSWLWGSILVLFHSSHGCSLWVTSQLGVLWFQWLQGCHGCERAWFMCDVPCLPQRMTGLGQVNMWNWKFLLGSRGHKSLKEHLKLGLSSTYDGGIMDIVFIWMGMFHIIFLFPV